MHNVKGAEDTSDKVTSSTPIKFNKSDHLLDHDIAKATRRILVNEFSTSNKLSSNLALMIGDISGIENGAYSDGHVASPISSTFQRSRKAPTGNEKTDTVMPSTLDLSDLDIGSVDSYKEFSIQDRAKRYASCLFVRILAGPQPIAHLVEKFCIEARDVCSPLIVNAHDLANFQERGAW